MKCIIPPHLLLFLIFVQIGCKNTSDKSRAEKALAHKADATVNTDTVKSIEESYVVNLKGDSVPYFHWAADNEIVGLTETAFGDLDSMIARRYIRVLVPYSRTYYYVEGMKRYGLAYDLLNLFEQHLNRQLNFNPAIIRVIFIPVSREYVVPLLMGGHADMIASGFTITREREKVIEFSSPTITGLKDVVVGGPSAPVITSVTDLAGKRVFVRENSSYQESLTRLNESLRKAGHKPIQIEFTG